MKPNHTPSRWINSLVERLAPAHLAEEIKGDLYELFLKDMREKGVRTARRRYIVNGLGFLTKRFFWRRTAVRHNVYSSVLMAGNFKMACRSLASHKATTTINVLGLVTGIAAALVILAVLRFEYSFDKFHSHADRIYRIVRVSGPSQEDLERSECRTGVSYPVPGALKEEIASLENIASIQYFGNVFVEIPDTTGAAVRRFQEDRGCAMVEPSFFKIFDFRNTDFKWLAGNPETALNEPFSVVLTRSLADKYFPDGNALDKTLRFERRHECTITGIIEDLPHNSDFPFTIIVSYASMRTVGRPEMFDDWVSVDDEHQTFVRLSAGTTKEAMEQQIARVHAGHTPEDLHQSRHYLLQPLGDLHYDPRFGNFNGRTITRETILAMSMVALFLLLTGSINYINLATAQSTLRSKEIGLRKVMGSNRLHLMAQFLLETFIIVLLAGILAAGVAGILLFNFHALLNIRPDDVRITDPFVLLTLLAIIGGVTLLAGFYPSLVISRFNPVTALKNKFTTETVGGVSLRKVLVVVQFAITQMLVVGTFMVVAQMDFFRHQDMGFNRDAVVTVNLPDRDPGKRNALADQLRTRSFVSAVSFSFTLPSGLNRRRSARDIGRADVPDHNAIYEYQSADPSFLELYQIDLLAGRNLIMQDTTGNILITRTLARNLAFENPADALGRPLKMNGTAATVVGVIDDLYANSLKDGAGNLAIALNPRAFTTASIRLEVQNGEGSLPAAIEQIEKIWTALYPEYIFDYQFLDDNIQAFYAQEQKYAQLFQLFSVVFLLIGCLGLYGLITFMVNRKGKEVAIRKVLGATVKNILLMFSREYVVLILLSFVLAAPVAYYVVNSWLSNFANQVDLHWWLFALPGLLVLAIAFLVIGTKSFGAAVANPVDKLKYE